MSNKDETLSQLQSLLFRQDHAGALAFIESTVAGVLSARGMPAKGVPLLELETRDGWPYHGSRELARLAFTVRASVREAKGNSSPCDWMRVALDFAAFLERHQNESRGAQATALQAAAKAYHDAHLDANGEPTYRACELMGHLEDLGVKIGQGWAVTIHNWQDDWRAFDARRAKQAMRDAAVAGAALPELKGLSGRELFTAQMQAKARGRGRPKGSTKKPKKKN